MDICNLLLREKSWKTKYQSILKQVKELNNVVAKHRLDLLANPNAKPFIITRTVGLQAKLNDDDKVCIIYYQHVIHK